MQPSSADRAALQVYCVDCSDCATRNADYPDRSRTAFQRRLLCSLPAAWHAGLAGPAEVALIASCRGRASVVLAPSLEAALAPALDALPSGGTASLPAALKLALLLARRAASAHITAFVASPCEELTVEAAQDLQARLKAAAGVTLDIVVLASQEELGQEALSALSTLSTASSAQSGPLPGCQQQAQQQARQEGEQQLGSGRVRVVLAAAAAGAGQQAQQAQRAQQAQQEPGEAWQQVEAILELLERRESAAEAEPASAEDSIEEGPSSGSGGSGSSSSVGGGASVRQDRPALHAPPHHARRPPPAATSLLDRREALRRPRAALLAARSGVHQPALCRHESLDWLGHIGGGFLRPWLPTYASLAKGLEQRSKGQGAGQPAAGPQAEQCFIQVCPIPKWRTLLKVSAGLMRGGPAAAEEAPAASRFGAGSGSGSSGGSSSSSGGSGTSRSTFASLSSALLQGLDALRLDGDEALPAGSRSQHVPPRRPAGQQPGFGEEAATGEGGSAARSSAAAVAAVRLVPDSRRGTLRLLQAVKEPGLFKLAWAPDGSSSASSDDGAAAPAAALPAFDMFAAAAGGSGGSAGAGLGLLGMPTPSAAAAAGTQPLYHHGIEYWEGGASFEVEVHLPLDALVTAHTLPNGAQVLVSEPERRQSRYGRPLSGGSGCDRLLDSLGYGGGSRGGRRPGSSARQDEHAAFWLQQRWEEGCVMVAPSPEEPGSSTPSTPGTPSMVQQQEQQAAGEDNSRQAVAAVAAPAASVSMEQPGGFSSGGAAAAASAVLALLAAPPNADLRQLRKDVKEGVLQVTPVTVGPLPSKFVQDIVNTRANIMRAMGVDNMDTVAGREEPAALAAAEGCGSGSGGGSKDRQVLDSSSRGVTGTSGGSSSSGMSGGGSASHVPKRRREGEGSSAPAAYRHHAALPLQLGLSGQDGSRGGGNGSTEQPVDAAVAADGQGAAGLEVAAPQLPEQQQEEWGGALSDPVDVPVATATPAAALASAEPAEGAAAVACGGLSTGSTPFGTPLHIVPSRLVRGMSGLALAGSQAGCGSDAASTGALDAAGGGEVQVEAEEEGGVSGLGAGALGEVIGEQPRRGEGGEDSVLFELE